MAEKKGISRKDFLRLGLIGSLGLVAGWFGWKSSKTKKPEDIPVTIPGANSSRGHKLRDGSFPPVSRTEKTGIVIVGGGIAGLSAAWKLRKSGRQDFIILELEDQAGGNSRWSAEKDQLPHPWGAHYLPVPNPANKDLIHFLEEIKVITGWENGLPVYDPYFICQDPRERLKIYGKWQYGLLPREGVPPADKAEIAAFQAFCDEYELAVGSDGKPAFNIPVQESSQDARFLELDQISMSDLMDQKGWHSPYLRWYVEYCCRDDFGTDLKNTSAWAGLHYFASRTGYGANAPEDTLLTWPEGNGFLARALSKPLGDQLRCGSVTWKVEQQAENVSVSYLDGKTGESILLEAEHVIIAVPEFIRKRLVQTAETNGPKPYYAPWAVANIQIDKRPSDSSTQLCWDNVGFNSPSLGYIVADHQTAQGFPAQKTSLTWYYPLTHLPDVEARREAFSKTPEAWRAFILDDMESLHTGITQDITQIDVWVWGHGMISPIPNYLHHPDRKKEAQPIGNIHFAHSDLTGISVFEEAFYHGLRAAREITGEKT